MNAVTSALTVLVLAGGLMVKIPISVMSTALFIAGSWAAAWFTFLTLRKAGHAVAGASAGFLMLLCPPLISLRGMETALYLGLLAASFYAVECRRYGAAGVLLGFAVLARPDAAVVAAAIVVWIVFRERAIPWRMALGAAVVLVPWVAVSIPLTGSILPSTLAAKVAQAESGYWSSFLSGTFFFPLKKGMVLWFLLALILGAVGILAAVRWRLASIVPLALGTVGLVIAYGVVLDVASYAWYVALPVFLLTWLAGCGAERLIKAPSARYARAGLAAALLAVAVVSAPQTPVMRPVRHEQAEVGAWLAANTPANATVAAAELGRIGVYSDRTMVDYLGLLDATALPYLKQSDWTWWVDELRPDYWVADRSPGFTPDERVLNSPVLDPAYVQVWETDHLLVFERRR